MLFRSAIGRLKERYPRVARYYRLSYDEPNRTLSAEFDADKHLHAERLDGCYLLKTSREDLSGDELWRIYILLTRAENAFRDMKSPLAERPIWHHLERRTDTHISVGLSFIDFHREDFARQGRAYVVGDSARYSQDPSDLHRRAAY